MQLKDIIILIGSIAGFLFTSFIPTVAVMINRIKAAKKAKSEAEQQAALNDLRLLAQGFVVDAENLWKSVDPILKANGISFGANKKDCVMTKLLRACIDRGIDFDEEYWSKTVDDLVAVTRQVNAK